MFSSILPDFELNKWTSAILVAIFTVVYIIFKRYRQFRNRYESIEDNELLMAKLKAARLKQQESYSQTIREKLKNENESATKTTEQSSNEHKDKRDNNDSAARDFYPLMNSASSYYRPIRKRPCGPCGGGGCG